MKAKGVCVIVLYLQQGNIYAPRIDAWKWGNWTMHAAVENEREAKGDERKKSCFPPHTYTHKQNGQSRMGSPKFKRKNLFFSNNFSNLRKIQPRAKKHQQMHPKMANVNPAAFLE